MPHVVLRPGDVVQVSAEASVQFSGDRGLLFRIIRVDPRVTYDGWLWLDGYVIGPAGNAMQRRRIFVKRDGLRTVILNRGPEARSGSRTAGQS
ncbi:hypothetical protein AB0F81_00890 [Actinoplanes sp. NPDC024001]|uniref:hypothetical protein n=1 Tax=Actinoplanes sp. NPDC024001 TaxID=3154598 RepID=UPI00340C20E2